MLTHLHIKNFTLVEQLDIELHAGLTAITGETGAGKSIMLDALGLTLGDRADGRKVRAGQDKAEIHASFDIQALKFAQRWLKNNDLGEGDECILRRIVTREGRSRAYINGQTVTLQQLRALGERLIDIHSQHEHQSLMLPSTHRRLVDEFAGAEALAEAVKSCFTRWESLAAELDQVRNRGEAMDARLQLLSYQVEELEQLGLASGELAELEREQRLLANAEKTRENCQHIADICGDEGVGLKDRINQAVRLLHELPATPEPLQELDNLLQSAYISIEESQADLERYLDGLEHNPATLQQIEQRLNSIYEIARKHRVQPEELEALHARLATELEGLQSGDEQADAIARDLAATRAEYEALAVKLSERRQKAAKKLAIQVNKKLGELAMPNARLSIELAAVGDTPSRHGNEKAEFRISTNPGQPPQTLAKVASGGELSRISLAIQVVAAATSTIPTLVFDEVDVGIGGTTGDVVGVMLSELGGSGQIFCVTHLAQVASKAHHHLRAEKHVRKKEALSTLTVVEGEEKILEIARMMGGVVDSQQSLDHARQMVETAS